jgi:predicted branched-subunit amino acid permease
MSAVTITGPVAVDQSPSTDLRAATRAALRDIAPCVVAIVPFGFAVGSASAAVGLTGFQAVFGAAIMLAGSGQLAAVQTIGRGEGILAVAVIVALVNMRFMFYGAAAARWFEGAGRVRRLLLVYPIVDQTFMLCQQRFETVTDLSWRQRYFVVATAALGGTFVACQAVSFHVGAALPPGAGLHLAAPLVFTGMLAGATRTRRQGLAAAIAAVVVTIGSGVLGPLALPVAAAAGVGVATRKAVTS